MLMLAAALLSHSQDNAPPQDAPPPAQPIPFSHKTHVTMGVQCDSCHETPDPGVNVTFPATSKCLQCHATIAADKPSIKSLAEYDRTNKAVPWNRVYSVPAWVFWNHRTHLDAGVKCESCHGEVGKMDEMKVVTDVTVMKGCVECHDQRGAPTGCAACHEDK